MSNSDLVGKLQVDDLCKSHRRICKLFCTNCTVAICGACMDKGKHDLHQVSNLAVVYAEKLSVVKSKLVLAKKNHNGLRPGTVAAYERNLQLLEDEEAFHRREIEAIAKESVQQVSNITNTRKTKLKQELELVKKRDAILADLQNKVMHLTANEFLQQFARIVRKCDNIAAPVDSLQKVDDIQCQLIPAYKFQEFVYPAFLKANNNDKYDIVMKSAHGVEWKMTIHKSATIRIELNPMDPQAFTYRHMLVVIMPHRDYNKEIRRTFMLEGRTNTFDLAKTYYVAEQEFCNYLGDLVMKIGIRPLNSLIKKQLAVYRYTQKKDDCRRLQSISEEYEYKHLIMHFKPRLIDLRRGMILYSYRILDDEAREWRLSVKLKSDGVVGAFIELFKGSATDCSYFIELKHKDPQQQVLHVTKCRKYDAAGRQSSAWGWEMIAWDDLVNDTGFHSVNGELNFRFGVRPLPEVDAANA